MALTAIVVLFAFVVLVGSRSCTRFSQQRHAGDDFAGAQPKSRCYVCTPGRKASEQGLQPLSKSQLPECGLVFSFLTRVTAAASPFCACSCLLG